MFFSGTMMRDGVQSDRALCRLGADAPAAAPLDALSYAGAARGVTVDLALGFAHDAGTSFANPPSFFDPVWGVANVQGSAFKDNLYGDQNDNHLMGGGGNDWLAGGAGGHDTLDGGAGGDGFQQDLDAAFTLVLGGAGNDMLFADERGADTTFDLRAGVVRVEGQVTMAISSVEYLHGAGGNDVFFAGEGRSIFYGGDGADLFVFVSGSSDASTDPTQIDAIFRFGGFSGEDGDKIFIGVTGGYAEQTAASYADAYALANGLLTSGAQDIVAVQVEGDVYVFADAPRTNTLDIAIKLEATNLGRIGEGDFI